jgi:hypothetical protein
VMTPHTISRCSIGYLAGGDGQKHLLTPVGIGMVKAGKRTAIHMPRWASRLTLIVTETKVEPVRELSEQDGEREGLVWVPSQKIWGVELKEGYAPYGLSAQECFMNLWCDLHGPQAWADNPEVVALTFAVHKRNIDSMKGAA